MPELPPKEIGNKESLLRTLFSPIHVNEKTGRLENPAFPREDLSQSTRGLSVQRIPYLTSKELRKFIDHFTAKDNVESLHSFYVANVMELIAIHDIENPKVSLFIVKADILPDSPSHANIFFAVKLSRSRQRKARELLRAAFQKIADDIVWQMTISN